jgi:hypothetical protein
VLEIVTIFMITFSLIGIAVIHGRVGAKITAFTVV